MVVPGLPVRDRCLVMGILNVTPDSFSDGGAHATREAAVRHGLAMVADGADIVDVGGESTRPHADRVPEDVEVARVVPVVQDLAAAGVTVSVDTMRARVARAAVDAGAALVNDVSGGLADPTMGQLVADLGVPFVVMHWRSHSAEMHRHSTYRNVVAEVTGELAHRLDALVGLGVRPERVIVDPGLGFAKTAEHNWELLRGLDALDILGCPVLVGPSRKTFLGALLAVGEAPRPVSERDDATAAVSALAAAAGAYCVRVHEVAASRDAVEVARAWIGPVRAEHDEESTGPAARAPRFQLRGRFLAAETVPATRKVTWQRN